MNHAVVLDWKRTIVTTKKRPLSPLNATEHDLLVKGLNSYRVGLNRSTQLPKEMHLLESYLSNQAMQDDYELGSL